MKIFLSLVFASFVFSAASFASSGDSGCELDGSIVPVGSLAAMNRLELDEKHSKGIFIYNGEGVMMRCTFLVDSSSSDWPSVSSRRFVWVAFSWGW